MVSGLALTPFSNNRIFKAAVFMPVATGTGHCYCAILRWQRVA
jgi:hypothetical protein